MSIEYRDYAILFYSKHIKAIRDRDLNALKEAGPLITSIESSYLIELAVKNEDLTIIKYLVSEGAPLCEEILNIASEKGNLEIVKYLFEVECPRDLDSICSNAICSNNEELIDYMLLHYQENMLHNAITAVTIGNLELVKKFYSLNKSCYTTYHMELAVLDSCYEINEPLECDSHLEIIKFLHSQGMALTLHCFERAIRHWRLNILKWLLKNDCPTNNNKSKHFIIDQYTHDHDVGTWVCTIGSEHGCIHCKIRRMKIMKKALYTEGYGSWLSQDLLDRIMNI